MNNCIQGRYTFAVFWVFLYSGYSGFCCIQASGLENSSQIPWFRNKPLFIIHILFLICHLLYIILWRGMRILSMQFQTIKTSLIHINKRIAKMPKFWWIITQTWEVIKNKSTKHHVIKRIEEKIVSNFIAKFHYVLVMYMHVIGNCLQAKKLLFISNTRYKTLAIA